MRLTPVYRELAQTIECHFSNDPKYPKFVGEVKQILGERSVSESVGVAEAILVPCRWRRLELRQVKYGGGKATISAPTSKYDGYNLPGARWTI
jgi:hypothetical protein